MDPLKWNTATSTALRAAYVAWLDTVLMLSSRDAHFLFRVIQVIQRTLNRSDFLHREETVAARIILMQVIIYYVLISELMSCQGVQ